MQAPRGGERPPRGAVLSGGPGALVKLRTALALGVTNVARVALYRVGIRSGLHPAIRQKAVAPAGPFFLPGAPSAPAGAVARESWQGGDGRLFGRTHRPVGDPPDWHANPFDPPSCIPADLPWWKVPDFQSGAGDIKTVWELSRFDWLIAMAQRTATGRAAEVGRLNRWLEDWIAKNPPYLGANWKCGQEASIRVMHLALSALLLDNLADPSPACRELVRLHLARIAPTTGYAIGQANNHGTSEAAALFIGGAWLARAGEQGAHRWADRGHTLLEERARSLIEPDGTFSQYSAVYQRLMLDTYSLAETFRRRFGLPPFSAACVDRLGAAADWLWQLADERTGDTPNLGANDGTRLMALADDDHRDVRPTVQLSHALFRDELAVPETGPWDQPLLWLGIDRPRRPAPPRRSRSFDDGGLHVLRRGRAVAFLRYPRFRFRPGQADALHCDLWVDGVNLLRDAGTYSYNAPGTEESGFATASSHCTIEFDGRDQMPRLGRFLYGDWLQARDGEPARDASEASTAGAAYTDGHGASHHRRLSLEDARLVCEDRIAGFTRSAILRWRLAPGDWRVEASAARCGDWSIRVESDADEIRPRLTQGYESRYYMLKTPIPVLEVELAHPGTILTEIAF